MLPHRRHAKETSSVQKSPLPNPLWLESNSTTLQEKEEERRNIQVLDDLDEPSGRREVDSGALHHPPRVPPNSRVELEEPPSEDLTCDEDDEDKRRPGEKRARAEEPAQGEVEDGGEEGGEEERSEERCVGLGRLFGCCAGLRRRECEPGVC